MKRTAILITLFFVLFLPAVAEYRIGNHEMFLMPTGETMTKGSSYFASYELVLLNFTYAPSSSTHVGVFSLFPFTSDFVKTITLSVKQRYFQKDNVKAAAWFTYTPENGLFSIGNVFSFGKEKTNFHIGIGGITDLGDSDHWEIIYMGGIRHQISRKVALLAEYTNFSTMIDEDYYGIISVGVRIYFKSMTIDFGGFRPLEETGDFLFFPILKATFYLD